MVACERVAVIPTWDADWLIPGITHCAAEIVAMMHVHQVTVRQCTYASNEA